VSDGVGNDELGEGYAERSVESWRASFFIDGAAGKFFTVFYDA
jgi:hypothetical protein